MPSGPARPHLASHRLFPGRWGRIKAGGPRAQPSVPREVPAMPRALPAPAPSPPARPDQTFTIEALLGCSYPPPPAPPPPPPQFWGPWGSLPESGPAARPLPPPVCIVCRRVPPAWATRLGDTDFLISKCCLPIFKAKTGKAKRVRTIFTSDQLARLEKEFASQHYMTGTERRLLASSLCLTQEQVKVWFQNRRIKWRKQSREQQQAELARRGLSIPQSSPDSQSHHGEEDKDFPAESGDSQEHVASSPGSGTAPAQTVAQSC
ncbi:homeobox protein not2-like [Indicator indicator]|uniref:homeobox protein not2-like n=1 Tax=Indicator indicator TaxID=1002788 RepID=UPI0023DEF860|nr:homeobox protein not2-like [Indicator indicator]